MLTIYSPHGGIRCTVLQFTVSHVYMFCCGHQCIKNDYNGFSLRTVKMTSGGGGGGLSLQE